MGEAHQGRAIFYFVHCVAGAPLYQIEYSVAFPGGPNSAPRKEPAHFVCVIGARAAGGGGNSKDGALITLNARVPESRWPERSAALREVADSFALL